MRSFVSALLLSIASSTFVVASEPRQFGWTRDDLEAVADNAILAIRSLPLPEQPRHIVQVSEALVQAGSAPRARAIMLEMAPRFDLTDESARLARPQAIQLFAQLGDLPRAEALASIEVP